MIGGIGMQEILLILVVVLLLFGAKKLIRAYRPRLAVCIYHRRWDVIILPLLVLWLFPGYRLTIRQYSASVYETVLLADVPEEKKLRRPS